MAAQPAVKSRAISKVIAVTVRAIIDSSKFVVGIVLNKKQLLIYCMTKGKSIAQIRQGDR
jgi:hypothetical protein